MPSEKLGLVDLHFYQIPGISVMDPLQLKSNPVSIPVAIQERLIPNANPDSIVDVRYGEPLPLGSDSKSKNNSNTSSAIQTAGSSGIVIGNPTHPIGPVDANGYCTGDPARLVLDSNGEPIYCKDPPQALKVDANGHPVYGGESNDWTEPFSVAPDGTPIYGSGSETGQSQPIPGGSTGTSTGLHLNLGESSEESSNQDGLDFYISPDDWNKFQALFAHKLITLEEAGYLDRDRNLKLLIKYYGNVNQVIVALEGNLK